MEYIREPKEGPAGGCVFCALLVEGLEGQPRLGRVAAPLPHGHVGELVVTAQGLALLRLILLPEVPTA